MEQILVALKCLGEKISCFSDAEALALISPVLECLQRIDADLSIQAVRLQSSLCHLKGETERLSVEGGISYVPFGLERDCSCIACMSRLRDQLELDLQDYLQPMTHLLGQQYDACLDRLARHPLALEKSDERISEFLNSIWIALSQIKNNIGLSTADRIDLIQRLEVKMSDESKRVLAEKNRLFAEVEKIAALLGNTRPELASKTLSELEAHLKLLTDQLAQRRSLILSSAKTVQKLWEIMDIPVSNQFSISLEDDFSPELFQRLEAEKLRLFDMQKERFKAMLEEQERELEALWNQIETPSEERQSTRDSLRQSSAVEALERQGELIAKLKPMAQSHALISPKIVKRTALIQRMLEFEDSAADPNRLFGSSFRLNQEERFRKAAYPTLVKIEAELLDAVTGFKEQFGRELVFQGKLVRETILEEKENRFLNDSLFFFTKGLNTTTSSAAKSANNGSNYNIDNKKKI